MIKTHKWKQKVVGYGYDARDLLGEQKVAESLAGQRQEFNMCNTSGHTGSSKARIRQRPFVLVSDPLGSRYPLPCQQIACSVALPLGRGKDTLRPDASQGIKTGLVFRDSQKATLLSTC